MRFVTRFDSRTALLLLWVALIVAAVAVLAAWLLSSIN